MLRRRSIIPFVLILILIGMAACGDDPFRLQWEENPRERVLYSLDREERNRPSAFEMYQGQTVIVESPTTGGRWDFALDRRGGALVLVPPRALGVSSRAGIAPIPSVSFEEVREAPADTSLYVMHEPVPLQSGTIYAIRTHLQPGIFGQQCHFYGKVEALEIDDEHGILRFRFDSSPECNDRSLVPPN